MAIPNIIICGDKGAGKSSLVNMIANKSIAQDSSLFRCTFHTFQSSSFTVEIGDMQLNLHETQSVCGCKTSEAEVIMGLYTLLRKLENGVNLLVFCMQGTILQDTVRNWELFCNIICQWQVPILLVITRRESEENMDDWWARNEKQCTRSRMCPNGAACITATRGKERNGVHVFDKEYEESQKKIWQAIRRLYLPNDPWRVPLKEWLMETIEKLYNRRVIEMRTTEAEAKELTRMLIKIGDSARN